MSREMERWARPSGLNASSAVHVFRCSGVLGKMTTCRRRRRVGGCGGQWRTAAAAMHASAASLGGQCVQACSAFAGDPPG